jgi:hypothetical protein
LGQPLLDIAVERPGLLEALEGRKSQPIYQCKHRQSQLVINLKTAKALGLEVSPGLLLRADVE